MRGAFVRGKPPSMLVMDQMEDVMLVFMFELDEVRIGRKDGLTL